MLFGCYYWLFCFILVFNCVSCLLIVLLVFSLVNWLFSDFCLLKLWLFVFVFIWLIWCLKDLKWVIVLFSLLLFSWWCILCDEFVVWWCNINVCWWVCVLFNLFFSLLIFFFMCVSVLFISVILCFRDLIRLVSFCFLINVVCVRFFFFFSSVSLVFFCYLILCVDVCLIWWVSCFFFVNVCVEVECILISVFFIFWIIRWISFCGFFVFFNRVLMLVFMMLVKWEKIFIMLFFWFLCLGLFCWIVNIICVLIFYFFDL